MRKLLLFLFFQIILVFNLLAQDGFCISDTEHQIYNVINKIRKNHQLERIPLSHSLTFVADVHAKDLYFNYNRKKRCSMHSWSDKGRWKACSCKNNLFKCMNTKPRELTPYRSSGFELVCYQNKAIDINDLYSTWENQPAISNIILQRSAYKSKKWKAVGIAVFEGYICVWFGERVDKAGAPPYCNEQLAEQLKNEKKEEPKSPPQTINQEKNITKACYVVLGSFNNKKDAQIVKKASEKKIKYNLTIINSKGRYRVCLLPKNYDTALSLRNKIKNKFPDCWIFCNK